MHVHNKNKYMCVCVVIIFTICPKLNCVMLAYIAHVRYGMYGMYAQLIVHVHVCMLKYMSKIHANVVLQQTMNFVIEQLPAVSCTCNT